MLKSFFSVILIGKISAFFDKPKETTFNFFVIAFFFKKLKNLSSLFKIITPLALVLSIISLLAFAIPLIFLKFSM